MVTPAELVAAIDDIGGGDPEGAHGELDDLLFGEQPEAVQAAIRRLWNRCSWWACA